jgi:hypothetical protein
VTAVVDRMRHLLPGLWLGVLLCIAGIATPAPFALLPPVDAGRVAGRMLGQEAWLSLIFGLVVFALERREAVRRARAGSGSLFSADRVLALGAVFCTLAGYFAAQPLLAQARVAPGWFSFGQLHAVSLGFFMLKAALVAVLTWRRAGFWVRPASSS